MKEILPDTFSFPPSNHFILPRLRSQSWTVWKGLIQLSRWRAAAAQKRSLLATENSCSVERSDTPSNPAASGIKAAEFHLLLLETWKKDLKIRMEETTPFATRSLGRRIMTVKVFGLTRNLVCRAIPSSAIWEVTPAQAVKGETETSVKEGRGGDALKGGNMCRHYFWSRMGKQLDVKASFSLRKLRGFKYVKKKRVSHILLGKENHHLDEPLFVHHLEI